MGTFAGPRNGGGKIDDKTNQDIIELITFDNRQYLAYKTFPIDVAIICGTKADTDGNVTMEKEALTLEFLSIAARVMNSNAFVIMIEI